MLLDLPEDVLRGVLLYLHPHAVQRLRLSCWRLHDLLFLRDASATDCDDTHDLRLINFAFALSNVRASIASWNAGIGNVDGYGKAIGGMELDWTRLGPDYLAALFCDYGFSAELLLACFPSLLTVVHGFAGSMSVLYAIQGNERLTTPLEKQHVRDFMSSPIAVSISDAVKAMFRLRVNRGLSNAFLSEHLASWILLLDDARLFEVFLQWRGETGVSIEEGSELVERAAGCGSTNVVRMLVVSRTIEPSPAALEMAVLLDDAEMVRLLLSHEQALLDPRRDLTPTFVALNLHYTHLSAFEALLEGPSGINTLPKQFLFYPDVNDIIGDPIWLRRVSGLIQRLIDTRSIGPESANIVLDIACEIGDLGLVQKLTRFPGINISYRTAILGAGVNGHDAIVLELLHTASVSHAVVDQETIHELFGVAAELGYEQVIRALVDGINSGVLKADVPLVSVKLVRFYGHGQIADILSSQYATLSLQRLFEAHKGDLPSLESVDQLIKGVLEDDPNEISGCQGLTPTSARIIGAAASISASMNVLQYVKDRWGISKDGLELEYAVKSEHADVVRWLVLNGAMPKLLTAQSVDFLFRNYHLEMIDALLSSPEPLMDLHECELSAFVLGAITDRFHEDRALKKTETSSPLALRRSNIILRLLNSNCSLPDTADSLLGAASYAGDVDLFSSIAKRALNEVAAQIAKGPLVQALDSILMFAAHQRVHTNTIPSNDADQLRIATIQSGQLAILRSLVKQWSVRGSAESIMVMKQQARKDGLDMEDILQFVNSEVKNHLEKVHRDRSNDLFSEEFMLFVILVDDADLFSEYIHLKARGDKSEVFRLAEKAVDVNAVRIVDVLNSFDDLPEDTLSQAVVAESSDIVRLLLSVKKRSWTCSDAAIICLFGKLLSESVVATTEALSEHPTSIGCMKFPTSSLFLYFTWSTGVVPESQTKLRRRALAALFCFPSLTVGGSPTGILPTLCSLGYEIPPTELRAAVSPIQDVRAVVHDCVRLAATAGEAAVVAHLLASATHPGTERADVVRMALKFAADHGRLNVIELVLERAPSLGVTDNELALLISAVVRSLTPCYHLEVYRFLKLALSRLSDSDLRQQQARSA